MISELLDVKYTTFDIIGVGICTLIGMLHLWKKVCFDCVFFCGRRRFLFLEKIRAMIFFILLLTSVFRYTFKEFCESESFQVLSIDWVFLRCVDEK